MRKIKTTVAQIDYLIKEWDFIKNKELGLDPNFLAAQSNEYAYWKCKYGHSWKAKISNRYHGRGCPHCNSGKGTSFPEQAVFFYIKKKFPDAINRYTDIFSNGMELDIFIPSIHVGIEYDGIAWHDDKNIHKEQLKYKICKENNIKLFRIKENLNHYNKGEKLEIADELIPVGKHSNYMYLDYAIRVLLCDLGDYDPSAMWKRTSRQDYIDHYFKGPDVRTDVNSKRDKTLILENYKTVLEKESFGAKHPEQLKYWHPTKNGDLTPFMFSEHSSFKLWWKDELGHEWQNSPTVMARGTGCPYCSGTKVLPGFNDLKTKEPEIAKQWHPTLNGNDRPEDFTAHSGHKAWWLCPTCKQSWQTAINIRTSNKRGCPYCTHQKPIKGKNDLVTLCPELMKEWNYDKNRNIDPYDLMPNSNKKVWWKCSKCGYEYQAFINLRNKGTGCKKCAGQVLIKGINDLETLYPEIAKEWDYELNAPLKPSDIFSATNKKYHWICKEGHKYESSPNSRIYGRGCPYCSGNKVLKGYNDLATTHPEIACYWDYTKNNVKPDEISKGYKNKIWLKCVICGKSFETYIGNRIKGYGRCPYCSNRKTRGKLILLIETGQTFKTLKDAAAHIGKNDIRQIQMCCANKCKTAYGYHWSYIENKD